MDMPFIPTYSYWLNDNSWYGSLGLARFFIRPAALETVERQCGRLGMTLRCLTVDRSVFDAAPVTRQYPQEMYYRLLAGCFLPKELDRVLYILSLIHI